MTIPPIEPFRPPLTPSPRLDTTRLAKRIVQDEDITSQHRTGVVDAINSDGTIDLDLGDTLLQNVHVIGGIGVGQPVQLMVWQGDLIALATSGYGFRDTLTYTSDDTFTKATYPWLRAIRVRLVGGGGAGGGAPSTTGTQVSGGTGGTAGGYAEAFIEAATLAPSEPITIGAGGTPVSGAAGGNGATTSFGALVVATGGQGGPTRAAGVPPETSLANTIPGVGTVGDVLARGGDARPWISVGTARGVPGAGGNSAFGGTTTPGANTNGISGTNGSGGSGTANLTSQAARTGGPGGDGIVLVDLYS